MNFKNWLITEEIWPNNITTVYHRTNPEHIDNILSTGWRVGSGAMYGSGLYTTLSIESQFTKYMEDSYGKTILKFKVTDINQYIICQKNIAQQVLGQNYKISQQLEKLNLSELYTQEQIEKFDLMMETVKYSADLAKKMFESNKSLDEKVKGIIYYGSNDGYCLVKYQPIEDGTIKLLGYANDVKSTDTKKMIELQTNCKKNKHGKCENPWTTSTNKIAVKSLFGSKKSDKKDYVAKPKYKTDDIESVKSDSMIKFLIQNNKVDFNGWEIWHLLSDVAKDKDEIAKAIIKNKKELDTNNIVSLLYAAVNKEEIAKLIGPVDMAKLKDQDVLFLLQENPKEEMFKALGPDNINKLPHIYTLFSDEKEQNIDIAKLIIKYKQLNDEDLMVLFPKDPEKIAQILGPNTIKKLSDDVVNFYLHEKINPEFKDKMIKILKHHGRI